MTVTGDGFVDDTVVTISLAEASQELVTTYVDVNTVVAEVPAGLALGAYDVTVVNPNDESAVLVAALEISASQMVFFVDPFTLYSGVNIQVTFHTAGILGNVADVDIFPIASPASTTALVVTESGDSAVQAIVPAGLGDGEYGVTVADDRGCVGTLSPAFRIVAATTVAIERVELPFGWSEDRTGVNIYSPVVLEVGQSNFAPTPRFYLNPRSAGEGTVAAELNHTSYVEPTRATAVVPAGMPVGAYDLIAVNPDGAIGLLEEAFEVTALAPPTISALLPASVVNNDTQEVTVVGENFRSPTFSALCREPDDDEVALVGSILADDATSIRVEFDFVEQTIADGSVCIITVTNDDATYASYSALGVTNPSLNLETFAATSAMVTARRAPCAVAGEAAPGARFVYAIGGDDGTGQETTAANYFDSIEYAGVDAYGDLAAWQELGSTLPGARSFHACTTIGRFVFVVGGSDGVEAKSDVWRAQILDPEAAPAVEEVGLSVDGDASAALAEGRYSYRVAAIFASGDGVNPGGESLASDPVLVEIPAIDAKISVTLTWSAVATASGYRVYRTAAPDQPSGAELLLAEVGASPLSFTDEGTTTPSGAGPLPLGALGEFAELPSLDSAREGAGLAVAADPDDGDIHYIYMLGGRDETGTGLSSVEWLDVHAGSPQSVGSAWTAGTATIGDARWQLAAYVANHQSAPDLLAAGESWVYAAGGILDDLTFMVPDVVALAVASGGALGEGDGERYEVDDMQPYKAGYAAAIFNNQLFAFGGSQADSTTECASVEMCGLVAGACSGDIPDPPDLANWNNIAINLTPARYLPAGVMVGAFIFVLGGVDDAVSPAAMADVARTMW